MDAAVCNHAILRAHSNRPTPIPATALQPVVAAQQSRLTAGACTIVIDALGICSRAGLEQCNELSLDGFAAIEYRGSDVQRTDLRTDGSTGWWDVKVEQAQPMAAVV